VESHVADIKNQNDYRKQHAQYGSSAKLRPVQRYVSETNSAAEMKLTKEAPAKT
jgi:hypothetical protein